MSGIVPPYVERRVKVSNLFSEHLRIAAENQRFDEAERLLELRKEILDVVDVDRGRTGDEEEPEATS